MDPSSSVDSGFDAGATVCSAQVEDSHTFVEEIFHASEVNLPVRLGHMAGKGYKEVMHLADVEAVARSAVDTYCMRSSDTRKAGSKGNWALNKPPHRSHSCTHSAYLLL